MTTKMRTISGLLVPWGAVGRLNLGLMSFAAGSISWADDVSRVKLLLDHDQARPIGYAASLEATAEGLRGTFLVDDTPEALAALASAAKRVRDGFSVGVELTPESLAGVQRSPSAKGGAPGVGVLREVSLVSVPAFDDSRVDDVDLDALKLPAAAAAGATITTVGAPMQTQLATAAAPVLATAAAPTGLAISALATASPAGAPTGQEPPAGQAPADPPAAQEPAATAPATATAAAGDQGTAQAAQAPQGVAGAQGTAAAPPAAQAGAHWTAHDGATYTLDGRGHSLVLDVFAAKDGDAEAAARLASFQRAMRDEDSQQSGLVAAQAATAGMATAAVETRDTVADNFQAGQQYRGDLLLRAIDQGRPMVSRVRQLPISGPNPFRLPTFGGFDGVGDHTEGTAHVPEGTATADGQVVVPGSVSGAFRLSRELAESTGPRVDALVVDEMVIDYRRQSEARLVATLELAAPAYTAASVDTADELLAQLVQFYLARQASPTVIGMGTTAYTTFATLKASDGRPYFPYKGATNTAGSSSSGLTAIDVQGVDGVPAWSAAPTDEWMLNHDDVAVFEAAPRTFRFEEVEGPGIIKLAIWGYQAAHVFRNEGVRRLKSVA